MAMAMATAREVVEALEHCLAEGDGRRLAELARALEIATAERGLEASAVEDICFFELRRRRREERSPFPPPAFFVGLGSRKKHGDFIRGPEDLFPRAGWLLESGADPLAISI